MVRIYPLDRNCMHYCFTSRAQIVLWSLVVYFALALYFYPTTPFSPFFNKAGLLAWVHTCHFHLHVAGWVGPLPHLSFHSLPGGACASLVGSSVSFQGVSLPPSLLYSLLLGCVAATLLARTLRGVLPPPPYYVRVHSTTCSPIYCQILCCCC